MHLFYINNLYLTHAGYLYVGDIMVTISFDMVESEDCHQMLPSLS